MCSVRTSISKMLRSTNGFSKLYGLPYNIGSIAAVVTEPNLFHSRNSKYLRSVEL